MRVGVCDFPSSYAFPPYGYGGIERWLWAAAFGAFRAGAQVHLIGPAWRADISEGFRRVLVRLEDIAPGSAEFGCLAKLGLDLLIVGHEYPSLPAWRSIWAELGCRVVTFQHDPDFRHRPGTFDGGKARLFCYSGEMMARYARHHPAQALSVQFGLGEEAPPPAIPGRDLLWLGRIDGQKVPHLAAEAAGRLGRTIRIAGPVLDHEYATRHARQLQAPHVELLGERSGTDKLQALREARVLAYTCARDYVEAGAAVFGEAQRSGTPVAALTWRNDTCAHAALCDRSGVVAEVSRKVSEAEAVTKLAEAIVAAERLPVQVVQEVGLRRFDPVRHFRVLADHAI